MHWTRFLFSVRFLKHFVFALLLGAVGAAVVILSLSSYTRHGKAIEMPDLMGQQLENLMDWQEKDILSFVVIDSVYTDEFPGGSVLSQDPQPGAMIKKGRKVYVSLVARSVEKVILPDLTDLTLRQASAMLETYGLTVDSLIFVPDVGKTVIKVKMDGTDLEPGIQLPKGTPVQLVIGRGQSNERVAIPFLIGRTREEGQKMLTNAYLNVRAEFYPEETDSLNLVISRQKPAYRENARIPMGASFDLWYEHKKDFDLDEALQQSGIDAMLADSLLEMDSLQVDTNLFEF